MLEQVSTSVKFLAFYTASKQGKTGLTVTVDIYDPSGTQIVTAGSATALGGGLYTYTLTSNNSSEGEYAAIFKTTDSTVDAQHIPSLWVLGRAGVENLDAATSTRLPSSSYAAAPSVSDIRTELSVELGRIDASVSSRSTLTTGDLPSVPSAASVATAVRTELTELSNLDASVSSRLASASYTAPANSDITAIKSKTDNLPASPAAVSDIPTTAQISAAVEGSLLNEGDGQAVLNAIVGAIGNQNLSEVSLVAAIRSDLERVGGKIDSIPTDAAPSAATVASAVWSAATKEITGGTVTTLTNSPDVPTEAEIATAVWGASTKEITGGTVTNLTNAPASVTPADIWDYNDRTLTSASGPTAVEIRQEIDANSSKLDVAISSRLADADYVEPANSDVAAIKVKTDALVVERLNNCATTAIVGNLLAQANS